MPTEPRTPTTDAAPSAPWAHQELLLAALLALAIHLIYLVGAWGKDPLLHGSASGGAASVLLLLGKGVQALLDAGTVLMAGAVAHTLWGRREGIFAAVLAALYGPLVYFTAEPSPPTAAVLVASAVLYGAVRLAVERPTLGWALAGVAALWAWMAAVPGGPAVSGTSGYLQAILLLWNRRELPAAHDPQFFGPYHSWLFRAPWLVSFGLLAPLGLAAAAGERRRAAPLLIYLGSATLLLASLPVSSRSRLLIVPGLFPLAGLAVARLVESLEGVVLERMSEPRPRGGSKGSPTLRGALFELARERAASLAAFGIALVLVVLPFPSIQPTRIGESLMQLALAYEQTGEPERAADAFSRAEQHGAHTPELYLRWGLLERAQGLPVQAEQHLLQSVNLDSGNVRAHEALADIYDERQTYDLAAQEYAIAAALDSTRAARFYTDAGNVLEASGDRERARYMFERALKADPKYRAAEEGVARMGRPAKKEPPVKMLEPLGPSAEEAPPAAESGGGAAPADTSGVSPPSGR